MSREIPRPYIPPVLVVMFALVIGINFVLYGYVSVPYVSEILDKSSSELSNLAMSSLQFVTVSDSSVTDSGYLTGAKVSLPSGVSTEVWLSSNESFALGSTVRLIGRFAANDDGDWGVSNRARGIAGRVSVVRVVKTKAPTGALGLLCAIRNSVLEQINPSKNEGRALLAGVLCASRVASKQTGLEDTFSKVGLSHLIAVSGSHLAVVAASFDSLLCTFNINTRRRKLIECFLTGLYVVFCASPASAVRSWIMFCCASLGTIVGVRSHTLSAAGICGIGMCVVNPYCACDLGFQLSVLSVCALAIFSDYCAAFLEELSLFEYLKGKGSIRHSALTFKIEHTLKSMRCVLSASLVCQISTLFSCAVTFGRLSLIAPLANVIIGPLFSPIVVVGLVGCTLSFVPVLGNAVLCLASLLCSISIVLAQVLAAIPFASLPVYLPNIYLLAPFGVGLVVYIAWLKPSRKTALRVCLSFMLAIVVWLLVVVVSAPAQIIVLDVGQGDAIAIRDGARCVLVDTGPSDAVVEALARNHIYSIDAVVLTHLHDDHTGGLDALVGSIGVGEVYVANGVNSSMSEELEAVIQELTSSQSQELHVGDSMQIGSFLLTCIWPRAEVTGENNEDSICFDVQYNDGTAKLAALLTGDAESDVLNEIAPGIGDIDVLKIGHHGSAVSITQEEANELKPEVAIASAGKDNSYGHPTQECVDVLEASGAVVACTIEHGDIALQPSHEGVRVTYMR